MINKNLLKFATSKIDNSSVKSQAAQILSELKKKKQNDKKSITNKDKGKVRQQNNYSVAPIRPQIQGNQMNMVWGMKRNYQDFANTQFQNKFN